MSSPFPESKTCRGPSHAEPVLLPLTPRYWYYERSGARKGVPGSRCKLCTNWDKLHRRDGPHGLIPSAQVRRYAVELLERCGAYVYVYALHGINVNTMRAVIRGVSPRTGEAAQVELRTAQRILDALTAQRRLDRLAGATSQRFRRAQAARAHDALQADRQIRRTS